MLVGAALTRIDDLPFGEDCGSWQATIHSVLRCVRPALCQARSLTRLPFCCAEAAGCPPERAIPVAAAWLLLYIAARLFDAVQDQDFEPRDWNGLSQAEAINVAGAFLVAIPLALTELEDPHLRADLERDFRCVTLRMAAGQHADLSGWIGSDGESVERYWQVATAKSGALFALACRAGARLGDPPVEILTAYQDFGRLLGQLVQACDDYQDTYDPGNLSDLQAGRVSLPIVYGRAVAGARERKLIEHLVFQAATDTQAASQLRKLLDDLGARHYLLLQIESLGQQAHEALQRASVTGPSLNQLLGLIPRAIKQKV